MRALQLRIPSLYSRCRASDWNLSHQQFAFAIERGLRKRFAETSFSESALGEYLDALYLDDLALAAACMEGSAMAWEHFISTYRGYLRASAAAILKNSRSGAEPRELADSLFAELYGLVDGKRGEASLFRYFHGRSSLKTWLRTILAQRHVDRLRQTRRLEPLERDDGEPRPELFEKVVPAEDDPHRRQYLHRFCLALRASVALLDPEDQKRLELYYAREKTLAEIGRLLGEHESSVSRNLDRARRELRGQVEECLRNGGPSDGSARMFSTMTDAEIALCFQYAAEDAPIDFRQLFPAKRATRSESGRKESS